MRQGVGRYASSSRLSSLNALATSPGRIGLGLLRPLLPDLSSSNNRPSVEDISAVRPRRTHYRPGQRMPKRGQMKHSAKVMAFGMALSATPMVMSQALAQRQPQIRRHQQWRLRPAATQAQNTDNRGKSAGRRCGIGAPRGSANRGTSRRNHSRRLRKHCRARRQHRRSGR